MPRLELRTADGLRITAECDLIPGHAGLNETQNITRQNNGEHQLEWDDLSTDMQWDASEPERRYGEALYKDEIDTFQLAGDLVIAEIAMDDDGNEIIVNITPYTEGIERAISYPLGSAIDRSAVALKYAQWAIGAAQESALGTLTLTARDRIQARAHAYAKQAGVHDLLQRILTAVDAT